MATYYKDCSELSIYLFHKILETADYTLLLTEGTLESEELVKVWEDIYSQYCKLSEDNASLMYFATASELLYLETRYIMASQLLGLIIECSREPLVINIYIDALAKWDYPINKEKPLADEVNRMFVKLKQSKNKIDRKKKELEEYKGNDSEPMTLTQQVVKLEQALGRNEIDPKRTSVEKWIMLMKEVKEKNEAQKKMRK